MPDFHFEKRISFRNIPILMAIASITTGTVVLCGWFWELTFLTSIASNFSSMTPLSALAFLFSGITLLLLNLNSIQLRAIAKLCALLVLALGLTVLAEYLFNIEAGIDLLLFEPAVQTSAVLSNNPFPGRPSQVTALLFILIALSSLLLGSKKYFKIILAQSLGLAIFILSFFSLVSFLYGVEALYQVGPFSGIALHTAMTFMLLSIGILYTHDQQGFMVLFSASSLGATLVRRVFLGVTVLTIILGWLSLQADIAMVFNSTFGMALLTTLYIIMFVSILLRTGKTLDRLESDRQETAERLAESEITSSNLINTAMDAIITIDEKSRILLFNQAAEALFGYKASDISGQSLDMLIPEKYRQSHQSHIDAFGRSGITHREMGNLGKIYGLRASGKEFPAEASISQMTVGSSKFFTVILRDISEKIAAQEALQKSEERLRMFIENTPAAIAMLDKSMRYLVVSHRWQEDYQLGDGSIIGKSHYDIFPNLPERWKAIHQRCLAGESANSDGDSFKREDGRREWLHWEIHPWLDASGEVGGIIIFSELITQMIETHEKIKRLNKIYKVLSSINNLIVRVQSQEELFRNACRICVDHAHFDLAWIGEYNADNAEITPLMLVGADAKELRYNQLKLHADNHGESALIELVINSGEAVFINDLSSLDSEKRSEWAVYSGLGYRGIIILPLKIHGEVFGIFSLLTKEKDFFTSEELALLDELSGDISFALGSLQVKQRAEELEFYDQLTGLPNHRLFMGYLSHVINSLDPRDDKLVLVIGDLQRFHQINDTHGLQAGDELLREVAVRLKNAVEHPENLARVGGNSFATFIPNISNLDIVHRHDEILTKVTSDKFKLHGEELSLAFSCGIAIFPSDGTDAETLYLNAEAALLDAKRSTAPFKFYEPALNAKISETLETENRLHSALEKMQFMLFYQPKFNTLDMSISGFEALIRWNDPVHGMVPPGEFIPLLESTGLILRVGNWVISQAIADWIGWHNKGLNPPRVAVNVTSRQLQQKDFLGQIVSELEKFPDAEVALDFEITESMLIENLQDVLKKIHMLNGLGIEFAIDDFGTGYSSLSYLANLPVSKVKIDQTFIQDILESNYSLNIVKTIISIASSLKLRVIAEGVDTERKLEKLKNLGCDEVQGFLLGKPMSAASVEELLLQNGGSPNQPGLSKPRSPR